MGSSMMRIARSLDRDRGQHLVFLLVALGAVAAAALAQSLDVSFFARFLGPRSPALVVACAAFVGALLLAVLVSNGWFAIRRRADYQGPLRAASLAAVFGVVVIAADLVIVFPADLNAPFPGSLLFYPAIALVVEVVFHLLPLTLLLALAAPLLDPERQERVIMPCLIVVALLEPAFQLVLGGWGASIWIPIFLGVHVAAINLAQLFIFRRHDFVSMLSFRLVYYLVWHIGWGNVRLRVLF